MSTRLARSQKSDHDIRFQTYPKGARRSYSVASVTISCIPGDNRSLPKLPAPKSFLLNMFPGSPAPGPGPRYQSIDLRPSGTRWRFVASSSESLRSGIVIGCRRSGRMSVQLFRRNVTCRF